MDVSQILPRIKTANETPIYEFMENDQTFPAGMWRWKGDADTIILERALATDWSSDQDVLTISRTADITTLMPATGDYLRIGDAGTTDNSLNSEDDLMVTGELEAKGRTFFTTHHTQRGGGFFFKGDGEAFCFGIGSGASNLDGDLRMRYAVNDVDARGMELTFHVSLDAGNNVPVLYAVTSPGGFNTDLGLFDGVTQPTYAAIEKDAKYAFATDATSDGADLDELGDTGAFGSAVVGDIVRITAGTRCTFAWYWITAITGQPNSVTLDRNFITSNGSVSNIAYVAYHDFTMLSADGICTRITDGAPSDSDIEIPRDGWIIVDVGAPRLYFRAQTAWKYITPDGGLSLTAEERIDQSGHKFEVGDEVKLVVDKINDDGSFHAMPILG